MIHAVAMAITVTDFTMQVFGLIVYLGRKERSNQDNVPIISILSTGLVAAVNRIIGVTLYIYYGFINEYWMTVDVFVRTSLHSGMIIMTLERFLAIYLHLRYQVSWFKRNRNKILVSLWFLSFLLLIIEFVLVCLDEWQALFHTVIIVAGNISTNVVFLTVYSYIYRAFRRANAEMKENLFRREKRKIFTPFFTVLSFLLLGTLPHFIPTLVPTKYHMIIWVSLDSICNAAIFIFGNPQVRKSVKSLIHCKTINIQS